MIPSPDYHFLSNFYNEIKEIRNTVGFHVIFHICTFNQIIANKIGPVWNSNNFVFFAPLAAVPEWYGVQ